MKEFIKKYWKTLLFFTLSGLIGGFLVGLFVYDSYPIEIKQQILDSFNGSIDENYIDVLLGVVTAFQSAAYGLILGGIGIFLGKKVLLWKDEQNITKKPLIITLIIACLGGVLMILLDVLFFGKYSDVIMASYHSKPSIAYILGSIIYGGVIEEVMLRLFFMSLISFVLFKLFERKKEEPSSYIHIVSNVVAALLFAIGHLPNTFILLGNTPLIIFRCILMTGGFGLLFGYLYHKHGLRYAMLGHAGMHIVSKLIWLLFI